MATVTTTTRESEHLVALAAELREIRDEVRLAAAELRDLLDLTEERGRR